TGYFLERIGVQSLDELPELAPFLPDMDDMEDELERVAASGGPVETSAEAPAGAAANVVGEPSGDTVGE
ncbi:MAG: scpB, partial [Nocardioides sp.]|nr:scpB [Nocardioides sp.]